MKTELKVRYDFFNLDYTGYEVNEIDGMKHVQYPSEIELVQFMRKNDCTMHKLDNGMLLMITNEKEPNIIGEIMKKSE